MMVGLALDGKRFHKKCFKCVTCNRKLDSTTVRVHKGQLYDRGCHKKITPDETPKIYADTSAIPAKEDEKGCPRCVCHTLLLTFENMIYYRCGGAVYEAEKVPIKNDVYHKRCFSCHRCSRALDALGAFVDPTGGNVFCKVCFKVVTAPERPQYNSDTTVIPADEEKEGCPRCNGKVVIK